MQRHLSFFFTIPRPPSPTLFPYTTLFRSRDATQAILEAAFADQRPTRASNSSWVRRSEEHTSELQSLRQLVCRLLLEKKKSNSAPLPYPKSRPLNTAQLWYSTLIPVNKKR